MKFLKRNANVIFICLLEALIGILLLFDPIAFTSAIIIACGVVLLLTGLVATLDYFRTDAVEAALKRGLAKGLTMLLAGGFCVLQPGWFLAAFPLLTILYGVIILLAGLSKVQWAVDALRLHTGRWILPAVSAVISIVCALVIFYNPFATTVALWKFTGITLIVEAALDVVVLFLGRGTAEYEG